jgi:hypothetical protein
MLQRVRGCTHTILAIETTVGEVFGCCTSAPWRVGHPYFGKGKSFLWRMRMPRSTPCFSVIDQAQLESVIDVFNWTGDNDFVQLYNHDQLALGVGDDISSSRDSAENKVDDDSSNISSNNSDDQGGGFGGGGFGLTLSDDLLWGTPDACVTFCNTSLSKIVMNGEPFEIVNAELWSLTPCLTEDDAERLEAMKLFLEDKSNN